MAVFRLREGTDRTMGMDSRTGSPRGTVRVRRSSAGNACRSSSVARPSGRDFCEGKARAPFKHTCLHPRSSCFKVCKTCALRDKRRALYVPCRRVSRETEFSYEYWKDNCQMGGVRRDGVGFTCHVIPTVMGGCQRKDRYPCEGRPV
jgi:hypothetical protein